MTVRPIPPMCSARYSRDGWRRPSLARRLPHMRNFSTPFLRGARSPATLARNYCSRCARGANTVSRNCAYGVGGALAMAGAGHPASSARITSEGWGAPSLSTTPCSVAPVWIRMVSLPCSASRCAQARSGGATDQGVVDNDGAPHPADVIRALLAGWPAPAIASAPPAPYAQFLATVFAPRTLAGDVSEEQLFAVRAQRFAAQHPVRPATPHLELLRTAGAEDEARAVDIQVRRWLLAGRRRVAIVTEDR